MTDKVTRGTTPTICFTYTDVDTSRITVAYMTMRQRGQVVAEKELYQATVTEGRLLWTLTQEETLLLRPGYDVEIQCRYRLDDGTAGASEIFCLSASDILKDGVV